MEHYNALSPYLKNRFGCKICKLSLSAGCTCPNRDGTLGTRGCMFCSGSGEFAASGLASIPEQLEQAKLILGKKAHNARFIAYFQEFTNTYGDVSRLEPLFLQAMEPDDVVALSIATRPDCLGDEVLALLHRLNRIKPVWVELGLQTIHEDTARFIRRGYPLSCFSAAVTQLRAIGIEVIVHVILGLPGEDRDAMLQTCNYLNTCDIQGIKLQLLHILKHTDLATYYTETGFPVMTQEAYITLLIDCMEQLSPKIVIHRLTGDGPGALLIAPLWSQSKRAVLNSLHAELKRRGTWQGRLFTSVPYDTQR